MQPYDRDNQRPEKEPADGRRDDERSAAQGSDGMARAQVPDMADRAVCLTANLSGKGGVAV